MRKHVITSVDPHSIGESLALEAGDFLLEIDNNPIMDIFDYRMAITSEDLLLLIEKGEHNQDAGELWELDIEKDIDEPLGLHFETSLMDEMRTCRNKCIFCFIDQQPPGLRDTLYVKDDDPRLSFLHGNYVTLTNCNDAEIKRIAQHHLSPLRLSVHTLNEDLRCKMTGNKHAGKLMPYLKIFAKAGIEMHFQAVICKGWNDGVYLDETITGLLALRPYAASLAIVPVGVTQHRAGLPLIEPITPAYAEEIITQVTQWQKKCLQKWGTAFVFPADEWYVLTGKDLPAYEKYEEFLQLDNGVGMCALFKHSFLQKMYEKPKKTHKQRVVGIITGVAAYPFMLDLMQAFEKYHESIKIRLYYVHNTVLGETVTVSGLLMGEDVMQQMRGCCAGLDVIFMPANAFCAGTEMMLDGVTRGELADALGVEVRIGSVDGREFYGELVGG